MCLVNLLSQEEKALLIKSLPTSFACFRLVRDDGTSLYRDYKEDSCILPGVYKAKDHPKNRSHLTYKPGFHVFRKKGTAEAYYTYKYWRGSRWILTVQEVRVSKCNIMEVGQVDDIIDLQAFVSSEITVPGKVQANKPY